MSSQEQSQQQREQQFESTNNQIITIRLARQQEVFDFVEKANDAEKANEFPSATHLYRQAIISLSYLQSMENEKEKKVFRKQKKNFVNKS